MLARPTDAQRARILTLRNDLLHLRRIVAGQRDMLARRAHLIERLPGLQVDEARDYFRDVHDHLAAISEQVDIGRERLEGALNMYAATVSQRVNDVTARLTLIATIFLPLSVVTGFYGQNFGWLVDHISTWEAFVGYGLGSLVLSGVLLYVYFRRSGFFEA